MRIVAIMTLAMVLACGPAMADVTWTGGTGGTGTLWADGANWDSGTMPLATDIVVFGQAGATADRAGTARAVAGIVFNREGNFTVASTGTTLLTISGGISVTGFDLPYTYTVWKPTFTGSSIDLNVGGTSTLELSNTPVLSSKTVTKTGTGTVIFSNVTNGVITAGVLDIQAGTIQTKATGGQFYAGGLTGTGRLVSSAGTLIIQNTADCTFGGEIASSFNKYGTGTLTIADAGIINMGTGAVNNYNGSIVLDNTAVNSADRFVGRMYAYGGDLKLIGHGTEATTESMADVVVAGRLSTIEVQHGETSTAVLTLSGKSGSGGMLMFAGNDLGGTGTYHSRVKITAPGVTNSIIGGYFRIGDEFVAYDTTRGVIPLAADHLSRTGTLNGAAATANVLIKSALPALDADLSINSLKIDGGHSLDLGGKVLTISSGGLIQTGSNNSITGGVLKFADLYLQNTTDLTISADIQSTNTSAKIVKIGSGKLTITGALTAASGTPYIYLTEGSLDYQSASNVNLSLQDGNISWTKSGTGTMTLRDSTNSSNDVLVTGGTVIFAGSSQLGTGSVTFRNATLKQTTNGAYSIGRAFTLENSTFEFDATQTHATYGLGTGSNINAVGVATVLTNNLIISKNIYGLSGSGTLRKTGVGQVDLMTATGSSSFTGWIDIAEGRMRVDGPTMVPAGAQGFNVASGAKMLMGISWDDQTLTGYTYTGGGTIQINSSSAGTGTVRRIFSAGGNWQPTGILTVAGNLSLVKAGTTTNSTLGIDVFGSNGVAGVDFDRLAVTGVLAGLDANPLLSTVSLSVNVASGLDLAGDVLTILTTSSDLTGLSFASVTVNGGSMLADVLYGVGGASLTNIRNAVVIKMGDADGDTFVDDDDLSLLLSNWKGGNVGWSKGDFNASGDVDDDDLSLLLSNWTGSGGGTIPEPATIGLLILGGIGLIRRRKA